MAAETHTGGMVAFLPATEHAQELALPGGEPIEELHVTIAYLGEDVTGWSPEQRAHAVSAATVAATGAAPIEGRAFAHTTFNPDGGPDGDRDPCAVYLIGDTDQLVPLRDRVIGELQGLELPDQHNPYVPHLTAGYGNTAADLSYTGPVTLDRLLVAFGEEHIVIPLGGAAEEPLSAGANGGTMTTLQRYGTSLYRELNGRPVVASGDQECFKVAPEDTEVGLRCAGCGHEFAEGEFYTDRPLGAQGAYEVVEPVCLPCSQAATQETPTTSYGQDRELPDPDGWVHGTIPVVVVEGMPTGDGRIIPLGSLSGHRALPLALMSLSRTGQGGHEGATLLGRIDHLDRADGPDVINVDTGEPFPEGTAVWYSNDVWINPEHEDYGWIRNGALNGISVDLTETEADLEFDEDNPDEEGMLVLRAGRIGAATSCTMPAFPGAYLVLDPAAAAVDVPGGEPPAIAASAFRLETEALCASCSAPPAAWFADPRLDGPTPITVTEDGRVFGHAAAWGVCHIGLPGGCTTAPRSRSGYAYFLTGSVLVDDGTQVPVGRITAGTGHAGLDLGYGAAAEHYDHTGACVADVAAGEDAHGIWVAGAVRPGATEEQVRALRASPLSGDWRPIGGALEMVGVLAVNTPGFPIPHPRARVAAGVPVALVAAGAVPTKKEKPMDPAAPPADAPPPAGPVQDGDVVTIADTGLQGVVTDVSPDGATATVEVTCDATMLAPMEDPAPGDGPPLAGSALTRVARSLRLIDAEHMISRLT